MPLPANRMFLSDESDIAVMALPGSPFITTAGPSEPPPYKSDGEGKIKNERERNEEKAI